MKVKMLKIPLCVICKQDEQSHDYESYGHPFLKDNLALLEYELDKRERRD